MATGDYLFGKDCHEALDDSAELAYVGSAVAADTDCDAYTNKVGGRPVLFAAQPTPRCAGCGATLALVLQAYLPLADPPDDRRQLLVCVCTSPRCRLAPAQRFAAFRVRLECRVPAPAAPAAPVAAVPSASTPAAPSSAPSLFAECSSWGDEDEDEEEEEDKSDPVPPVTAPAPPPPDAAATATTTTTAAEATQETPAVEAETAPAVLGEAAAHPFAARYLETEYEPDAPEGPTAAEAAFVRELLARYEAREAAEHEEQEQEHGKREGSKGKGGSGGGADETDVYEHAAGDRAFRRFQRRVQRAPTQVLRWCYGGRPLQLCDATPLARVCVPRCPRCGARRVFEAQLMPALLDALAPPALGTGAPALPYEFGSVLVCTCGADCDTRGALAPEHVVWQPCL